MTNKAPGDNPITDNIIHGRRSYPLRLEKLIIQLNELNPDIMNSLKWESLKWEKKEHVEEATVLLKGLVDNNGNQSICLQLIDEYKSKTTKGINS